MLIATWGICLPNTLPIGSMYGIYANIWGVLMVNVTIYMAYMDPMDCGFQTYCIPSHVRRLPLMMVVNLDQQSQALLSQARHDKT